MSTPDYVGVQVGWRAWDVVDQNQRPVLRSVTRASIWHPRERFEAVCSYHDHEPPNARCQCGIYAADSRERLLKLGYNWYNLDTTHAQPVVIGEVNLWGGIVPADFGYRAQYGYPKRLYVPYECWELALPLRKNYGVSMKLSNTFKP